MRAISKLVLKSNNILKSTFRKDTEVMKKLIQEAHAINILVIKYNDKNLLACIITLVYLSALSKYNIIREMPAGVGFADFILSKKVNLRLCLRAKRYATAHRNYTGKKLAVEIFHDKKHSAKIEDI